MKRFFSPSGHILPSAAKTRLVLATLLLGLLAHPLGGKPREAQWKRVNEAAEQALPKTAIERLKPILRGALADQAWAEAVRAMGRKFSLEDTIQEDHPEARIVRLQAAIA